jgi:hypothetical protein
MSTTRGIAFAFVAAAALLLLGAAPCDAALGVGGATITSCPAPGAPALANPVHMIGGPPSPIHGTGDEPASNAKMRRIKGRTAQPGTTGRGGHAFLRVWSEAVLSIVSVAGVGVASVRFAGRGSLISHGARYLSHRRQILRSAMVGLAVMSSEGAGVSAAACTASTCCNVAIPKLDPLTTTTIDGSVCSEGT